MSTRRPSSQTIALPSGYAPLLADLKARVHAAQVRAVLSVNRELILLYWHIGGRILRCQREEVGSESGRAVGHGPARVADAYKFEAIVQQLVG
jgi:hypothetical protein